MRRLIGIMALAFLFLAPLALTGCETEEFPVGDDTATFESDDFDEEWGLIIDVKLEIIGADDDELFSGTVTVKSMNPVALEALEGATAEKGISLDEAGGFINAIGGYANDFSVEPMIYWHFQVNGESAHLGAGTYQIRDGDHIAFHYKEAE